MVGPRKHLELQLLPAEILTHILFYLIPTGNTINVYRWRRRNWPEKRVPLNLLLVNKAFRDASLQLFYEKNIVAFREMADMLYVIHYCGQLTTSNLQFIQVTAPYDRFDFNNFVDGIEMKSLSGGPVRLLLTCPNIRLLRIQDMGFAGPQPTFYQEDRDAPPVPGKERFDFDAIRLLKLIECPSSLHDGDIWCNGRKKESTIVKKGSLYVPRDCDIRVTKAELMKDADQVERRRADTARLEREKLGLPTPQHAIHVVN